MNIAYLEKVLQNLRQQLEEHGTQVLITREQLKEHEKNAEATSGAIQAVLHLIEVEKQNGRNTSNYQNTPDTGSTTGTDGQDRGAITPVDATAPTATVSADRNTPSRKKTTG